MIAELRGILLLRTPLHKGKKEGRRCYTPALDDSLLGPLLHASVGYSTTFNRILDPTAQGVFINGGVIVGNGRTDDEIIVDFARALRTDSVARALIGPAARRYLA